MRPKVANAKIAQLKRKLTAAILRETNGLSVRQAEPLTGLRPITISRLRRGLDRDFSLEGLLGAAMNLGLGPRHYNLRRVLAWLKARLFEILITLSRVRVTPKAFNPAC
jgi:hypothetical protein